MFLFKKLLSAWLLPPLGFLVIALFAVTFLQGRRLKAVAGIAIALTLLLSLPLIANTLSRSLEGRPASVAELSTAQAIVVLGGGVHYAAPEYGGDTLSKTSLERVRYGARLARDTKLPILVTGGSVYGGEPEGKLMQRVLENEFFVAVRWAEAASRNTQENAAYSAALLRSSGVQRIALVTHAWHMPRAAAAFAKTGLEVTPAPMGFAPREVSVFENLLPSTGAFERSANTIREWVGRLAT